MLFVLLMLVSLAQLLGYVFVKLRQPKVVGEILAGVVLGPALLGRVPWILNATTTQSSILSFVYWLGLLLLMFLSGAEAQQLFTREERREVGWLAIVGTGIPFVLALVFGPWLIRPSLAGTEREPVFTHHHSGGGRCSHFGAGGLQNFCGSENSAHTICAAGAWGRGAGRYCAVARAGGGNGYGRQDCARSAADVVSPARHDWFFALGLTLVPRLIKRLNKSSFNVFAKQSPVAYAIAVLLGYCVVAGALNVSLVFAAFLAGFAVVHKKRRLFADAWRLSGRWPSRSSFRSTLRSSGSNWI